MIKVANNLTTMCLVKIAEEDEVEKAKKNVRKKEKEKDIPDEDREVDYAGRARRGGLMFGIPGAILGGLAGAGAGYGLSNHGTLRDGTGYKGPQDANYNDLVEPIYDGADSGKTIALKMLLGGGIGALGGGLLYGGAGALGNMLQGFKNEDIITRRSEPNRLRRAAIGAIPGALAGGLAGGAIGSASRFTGDIDSSALLGTGLGVLGGAGLGALGGGVIEPYLNKDMYNQNYIKS